MKELDPILHSQLRLAIVSILMASDEAEFNFIKDQTQTTAGNLSVQISKLKDAGYIDVEKKFHNNYPQTICRITDLGIEKFQEYALAIAEYLQIKKQ